MSAAVDSAPRYPHRPIGSVAALARDLGVNVAFLTRLARRADRMYRAVPQPKADGTTRLTYDAKRPLKHVQGRINERLLRRVEYPYYLQGSIRDPEQPRQPITNAAMHAGRRVLIQEDVKGFFGAITPAVVDDMWRRLFGFSPEVAEVLTALTTYNGFVPEGARTSSYIANLVLWDVEPAIVAYMKARKLAYTRYVDDITVSSAVHLSREDKYDLIRQIYGMLAAKGLRPKRNKHRITKKGQATAPGRGAIVTGYAVSAPRPTVSKAERKRVRVAVRQVEIRARSGPPNAELQAQFRSAWSRVDRIARCRSAEGATLLQRLGEVKPSVFPNSNRRRMYGFTR